LSMNCGFTDVNEKLCDQLVCGLQDKETKIRLFEQEKLTYEDAVKIAKARESAVKNAAEAQSTLERKNPNSEVYMLRKENKGNAQQRKRVNSQGQSNRNIECYCCGKPNHISRECRYKEFECNFCKRKGHLERACRSKQNQRKTKSSVNLLQEESSDEEEDEISTHETKFYNLKLNKNVRTKKQIMFSNLTASMNVNTKT